MIDLPVTVRVETEMAYGILDEGDEDGPLIWLPKSQCEVDDGILTCPEWLAQEKGLI